MLQYLLLVGVGGALGAMARYSVDQVAAYYVGSTLLGTFFANISGSLVLGLLVGVLSNHDIWPAETRMFLGVGFLGSYTTFSTLSLATAQLLQKGDWSTAALNLGASIVLGIGAALVGLMVGKSI
ncbi:MAG: CrcB protein [Chloroflexi bacterium]|nr:MAG: CrcB protein [Chloroflexota bacterium]